MFCESEFKQNIISWTPYKLDECSEMYRECEAPTPYWAKFADKDQRSNAIDNYLLKIELDSTLNLDVAIKKKVKI